MYVIAYVCALFKCVCVCPVQMCVCVPCSNVCVCVFMCVYLFVCIIVCVWWGTGMRACISASVMDVCPEISADAPLTFRHFVKWLWMLRSSPLPRMMSEICAKFTYIRARHSKWGPTHIHTHWALSVCVCVCVVHAPVCLVVLLSGSRHILEWPVWLSGCTRLKNAQSAVATCPFDFPCPAASIVWLCSRLVVWYSQPVVP